MELIMVRHALPMTVLGAEGPADPGLTPAGHAQAARLAEYVANEQIDRLVTSPLRRARETVEPLSRALGIEAVVCENLAESDRYLPTYVPMEELRRNPALAAVVERANAGSPREGRVEFRDRVVEAMERLVEDNPARRVLVMSHGGVINAYLTYLLGLDRDVFFEPRYTGISRVLASRRGHRNIETLNETHHLRAMAAPR